MIRTRLSATVATLGVLCAVAAHAQEASKIGITMAYPASFGVIWPVTDSVAVRPSVVFSHTTSDSAPGISSWNTGVTLAALLYLKKYDNVRTYVSPSYRYSRTSASTTPASTVPALPSFNTTENTNGGAGTFGAEYAPNPRVRIFGEIGFAFSHLSQSSSGSSTLSVRGNTWGTTAGIGLIFYP